MYRSQHTPYSFALRRGYPAVGSFVVQVLAGSARGRAAKGGYRGSIRASGRASRAHSKFAGVDGADGDGEERIYNDGCMAGETSKIYGRRKKGNKWWKRLNGELGRGVSVI